LIPGVNAAIKTLGGRSGAAADSQVFAELWISLASLLRSYTAVHGLHGNRRATVAADEEKIMVRHQEKWLCLERDVATVTWTRDNGKSGRIELSEDGRLRGDTNEEEMDLAAEAWARELMR
jgi:hypothetical protein